MSTHAHTGHDAHLAQIRDPTNTKTLRERFLRAVRRRFRRVRGRIRAVAGYAEDRFNQRQDAALADADDIERFPSDSGKTRAFVRWLRELLREEILETTDRQAVRRGEHWTGTYIRAAYRKGWEQAVARLRQRGASVDTADDIFRLGVPQRQLRRLYTRVFENLASVTQATAPQVRDVLTRGLAEGVNPRELARRLTKEVRTLQRTRAEVLARTEIIRSHAEASLSRYERAGTTGVTVSGEIATAEDDDVCPICEHVAGDSVPTGQMRDGSFTFSPSESEPNHLAGECPLLPPLHPRCRCTVLPVVG